ncbi:MAG: ABC transporter ATP-binding protein [Eubacteriales bacterium]|nr:ABC transporter ATP-binding protein [Eubacteriales bacterium]
MAEKKVTLKLENVSKSFAKVENDEVTHALNQVSLEMHSGEFISLVGPSGCGKSTILRLIAGLINPTTGKVLVDGEEILKPSPERGMVFQKPTLFPWLTVEQNIAFSLKMQGTLKGNEDKVERMIQVIGLEQFREDYPGQLSGGMAQRVALVRSLINEPDILLLDEPLGALDAFTRMNMQDEILKIWQKRGQLAIMVTHDVDEAIYMGTRVIVMDANPGRVVSDIKIEDEYPRDRSSANFVAYRNEILNKLHFGGKKKETQEAAV